MSIPAREPHQLDVEQEPSVLSMIVGRLNDLGSQIRHLDRKNDTRFDGVDEALTELRDDANRRLTALETEEKVSKVLGERKIRASDRRRHIILAGVGVAATLGGSGLGLLIQQAVH